MVAVTPATQLPRWALEVKWSDRIEDHVEDLGALAVFLARHPDLAAVVTTRTRQDERNLGSGQNIRFVPAPLYAYAAGYLSARQEGAAYLLDSGASACGFMVR